MKSMLKIAPAVCLFFALIVQAIGQPSLPKQEFYIHFDKSLYYAGELVWMSVYATGRKDVECQIQVLDPDLNVLQAQYIELTDGHAATWMPLPGDLPEGYYFVKISPHNDDTYHRIYALPVFSESTKKDSLISLRLPDGFSHRDVTPKPNVKIEWAADTLFRQGARAVLTFRVSDDLGNPLNSITSVSVFDGTGTNENFSVIPTAIYHTKNMQPVGIAEDQILFRGVWKSGSPPPASNRFLAFQDVEADRLYPVLPDSGGFMVIIDKYTGDRHFQLINWNPFESFFPEFEVRGADAGLSEFLNGKPKTYLFPTVYHDRYLKRLFLDSLWGIKRGFPELPVQQVIPPVKTADRVYHLKEYEYVKDFASFFRDAVASSGFIKTDDGYSLRLYSRRTANTLTNAPLYQAGGYYIGNESLFLSDIHPADSMEIHLFTEPKTISKEYHPSLVGNGIVVLKNAYIQGLLAKKQIPYITLSGIVPAISRRPEQITTTYPDLEDQVFWASGISGDTNGRVQVTVKLPDITGKLTISVAGVTENGIFFTSSNQLEIIR